MFTNMAWEINISKGWSLCISLLPPSRLRGHRVENVDEQISMRTPWEVFAAMPLDISIPH